MSGVSSPRRLALGATLALLILPSAAPLLALGSPETAVSTPAARLRQAWIEHRLRGDRARAEMEYREVAEDPAAPVDLRARARLGLSLLAGEEGAPTAALAALDAFDALGGVSPRWRETARLLRARWEGTETTGSNPPDFLVDLQDQVVNLQREIERLEGVVESKEVALAEQGRLLERQEEIRREAEASISAALRREGRESRGAEEVLLAVSERERQRAFFTRSRIGEHLVAGLEAFQLGEFSRAYNETKKILAIDPDHEEAKKLASHCRLVLAWSAGRETLDPPEPGRYRGPRDAVLPLALAVMRASLTRAIHAQEEGRHLEAMAAATKVLEEYAWCPVPLPPDALEELVGAAERILDECLGEGGAQESVQLRALREEQLRLLEALRRDFGKLVAAELALDRAGPGAKEGDLGLEWVLSESESALREAEEAIAERRPEDAVRHLRDLKLLIDWFPELDREGRLGAQLDVQISALEGTLSAEDPTPERESPAPASNGSGSS
ncbi:MAG: hypothetical protein ACO4BJ_01600 [Planctomycetota bacterium]